jgi:hypothetical protein
MSFVTAIRDYIELLNTLYDSTAGHVNSQVIVQETIVYLFTSIKYLFFYLITFQWFRDLSYLPILVPELYSSLLKETFFLENPVSHFLSFIEPQSYENNKLLIGFLNSFFLSLPISCVHFIWLRRLLIQGIPAGIASGFGTVLGQWLFTTSVLFGLRFFIIPWVALEPLTYILGVFLIINIIHDMAHEKSFRIIKLNEKKTLIKIFLLNLILSWTEQSCIFQYFGNLNFGPEPTALESFSSTTELDSFLIHGYYSLGLLFGSVFFTLLFGWLFIRLGLFIRTVFNIQLSRWMNSANFGLLSFTIALTFTSIPYYGLDYLITKPLGFVSQDQTLEKTIFSPNTWKDKVYLKEDDLSLTYNLYMNSDLTPFDRGHYLQLPQFFFTKQPQNFEDLNYQGEFAWTQKDGRTGNLFELDRSRKLVKKFFSKNKKEVPFSVENQSFKKGKEKQIESLTSQSDVKPNISSRFEATTDFNENQIQNSQLSEFETDEESDETLEKKEFDIGDFGRELAENNKKEYFLKDLAKLTDESFIQDFIIDDPKTSNLRLERSIKQKYYSNPVYKFLLKIDIDSFLSRQPENMKLSSAQEKQLYEKRLMLANYYDSLRNYQQLSDTDQFKENLSRSYADRVFNHQFKGTLKVVRRLFSVTLDSEENPTGDRVLKFDNPLYYSNNENKQKFFHEELYSDDDQNIEKPFLEITDSVPFYAGWDQQTRKLVLTNRLLPRTSAGYIITPDKTYTELLPKNRKTLNKKERIDFTAWPLPESFVKNQKQNPKSQSKIPFNVLFESVDDPKNKNMDETFKTIGLTPENDWKIETYPPILNKINSEIEEIVPPNRGGYIWPGNSTLKFNIKEIILPRRS